MAKLENTFISVETSITFISNFEPEYKTNKGTMVAVVLSTEINIPNLPTNVIINIGLWKI